MGGKTVSLLHFLLVDVSSLPARAGELSIGVVLVFPPTVVPDAAREVEVDRNSFGMDRTTAVVRFRFRRVMDPAGPVPSRGRVVQITV